MTWEQVAAAVRPFLEPGAVVPREGLVRQVVEKLGNEISPLFKESSAQSVKISICFADK